uniref:F180B protein n=1 Tax=Otus sunia TaxID=257818 RepID=A0A8C8A9W6_9STRI
PPLRERPPLGPARDLAALQMALELAEGLCWMLWGGLDIQANRTIRLRDEELASLRPARQFMRILEDEVPKTQTEIEQHLRYYSLTDTHLPVAEFDRLLFTSVYCAYQVRSTQGLDKNLWISFFSQLGFIQKLLFLNEISPFPLFFFFFSCLFFVFQVSCAEGGTAI